MSSIHYVEPRPGTVHGCFSRELPPILEVDSGDTVRLRTLDADWGLEQFTALDVPRRKFRHRLDRDKGHALLGPIAVRGAHPEAVLEVEIHAIRPGRYGWTIARDENSPPGINAEVGVSNMPPRLLRWSLDPDTMTGTTTEGFSVGLRPFMGILGMPPDEPGVHPTWAPRNSGGNLDCKELIAGSTLFLPIPVVGALFSVGDGHGAQGDGEVCTMAIECPMDHVELTLRVNESFHLKLPRAKTPAGWIAFGFDADMDRAVAQAVSGMLDLMQDTFHLTRTEALALASVVVDVHVTQIVNGVCGAHAILPHGALRVPGTTPAT